MTEKKPLVAVVMGSDSDLEVMMGAVKSLRKFEIPFVTRVISAHRTPAKATEFAKKAKSEGFKVIIAGAGFAAHLAGVLAAETTLPVIGVPIPSSPLSGWDSLLSTAQMPPGVPVATMGVGESGATNAGILAAQILSVGDSSLAMRLAKHKVEMAQAVEDKDRLMEKRKWV